MHRPDEPATAAALDLQEQIDGLKQSAEMWRPHALRDDSLGECARRKHLRCLEQIWKNEQQLADLNGADR